MEICKVKNESLKKIKIKMRVSPIPLPVSNHYEQLSVDSLHVQMFVNT